MKLREAVLATLTYSDHFSFPLTPEELHLRLIARPISRISLIRQIRPMVLSGLISRTGRYYHLPGREKLTARRDSLAASAVPQLMRARTLAARLGHVPGVHAVYLTGSLAVKNAPAGSDIDFMVITVPHRLWTTRLLLTAYCSLFGLRRTPHSQNNSGKLCLNLFLSPLSYLLSPNQRSLYTAYELVQALPLYDPHHTHPKLLAVNSWIHDYLPNFPMNTRVKPSSSKLEHWKTGTLENFLYHLQLRYMRPRITREIITPHSAFFHPHDPGAKVLKKLAL